MTRQTAFLLLLCCFTAGNLHADDLFSWWQSYRNTAKPAGQKQRNESYVRYYEGVVTAVSDGDTLRMIDTHGRKHKIRLAYIDAPELQQAHGQAARRVLEKAVWGQTAEVRIFDIDRYGREVAQVWVQRQDVNLMQIQQGYAWHYASIAKRRRTNRILPPTLMPKRLPATNGSACGGIASRRHRGHSVRRNVSGRTAFFCGKSLIFCK